MSQAVGEQISPKTQPPQLVPSQIAQTPRFDPELHKSPVKEGLASDDEDSFVQSIISRSAFKSNNNGKWADQAARSMPYTSHCQARDFQEFEDPLEAIDALEDALEQIGQSLPVMEENGLDSPVRASTPTDGNHVSRSNGTNIASKKHNSTLQSQHIENGSRSRLTGAKQSQPLSMRPKLSSVTTSHSTKNSDRVASKSGPSGSRRISISRKSSHSNLPSNTTSTLTSRANKTRANSTAIASISKPGFTPSKSTKPPTRPTFELPGEAISRRQKAQREERLKQEEQELQRRREFKARTPRNYSSPSFPVKETIASRSRTTLKAEEALNIINAHPDNSKRHTSLNSTRASRPESTRTSSLGTAMTRSAASSHTQPGTNATGKSVTTSASTPARPANQDIANGVSSPPNKSPGKDRDKQRSEMSPVSSSRSPITPATSCPRAADATPLVQRSRGKEIFARDRIHEIERDRERREKEEAARRARTEAAERGRIASREWAERQKLKLKLARKSQSDLPRGEMGG
ncbi:hypothetical protein HCBG_05307 [Histoplasma capsulatum G186AR]|uniref:Carboxylesterase family protein n=3 Tax=Ajellomyces capsulatus TaxID=5037 RepID=C0NQM7_AJECG|nr:uncharacterized protein HCBG_05307 [Histoplasma capsulatum G186AR]EEH05991.1 hypothetical protein HCBG_05307 [Histoplasma capsulatum G186AR]